MDDDARFGQNIKWLLPSLLFVALLFGTMGVWLGWSIGYTQAVKQIRADEKFEATRRAAISQPDPPSVSTAPVD